MYINKVKLYWCATAMHTYKYNDDTVITSVPDNYEKRREE